MNRKKQVKLSNLNNSVKICLLQKSTTMSSTHIKNSEVWNGSAINNPQLEIQEIQTNKIKLMGVNQLTA